MHSIEQQALQRYKENLTYFESKHPELHKKLITLETAISNGIYNERYALEYKEEYYFDIQNINTKEFLYNENSNYYTNNLLDTINLKRTGAVFEGQQRFNIQKHELKEIGEFKNFHSSLWATAKIIHYNLKTAPKASSEMQKLYKFIFLGTGLGLHIPKVISKFNIKIVYIQENNLEIFRLSLFTTNYANALKDTIAYFSIMHSFTDMQHIFTSFLNESFNHNLYIKFLPFSNKYQEDLNNLQSITISQNHITYPYQAYIARSFSAIKKIAQGNCFLNVSRTYQNTTFSDKPILVLSSGPSLQNNTSWIQKNQDKFLIVSVLSACKHLSHYGIKSDIIVHIDPQKHSLLLIEDIDMEYFDKSTLIFGSSVHQSLIDKFNQHNIIFIEEATTFKVNYGLFTLPSIGEYASILPLIFGAKEIFLIGLDLALDPNTMKDHIDLHIRSKELMHSPNEESISYQESICYVKGNFLDTVPSKPNFRLSITQFNKVVQKYKQMDQHIYNLSNGAYLDGTLTLHIEDVKLKAFNILDKKALKTDLNQMLLNHSSCEYREIDRLHINQQLILVKDIINKCKKLHQVKSKEPHNYLFKKLLPFVKEISEMDKVEKSDIGEIFFEYFKITLSFIFDIFNTKDLKDIKKHVQSVDKIILDEVEKIATTYYETISEYTK